MNKLEIQAEAAAWRAHISSLPYSPDAALVKFWRKENAAGRFLGVPVTGELPLPGGSTGQVCQYFSSGARLVWMEGDTVVLSQPQEA